MAAKPKRKGYAGGGIVQGVSNLMSSGQRSTTAAQDDEEQRRAARNQRDSLRDESEKQIRSGASRETIANTMQRAEIAADRSAGSGSDTRIYPRVQPEGYPPPRAKGGKVKKVIPIVKRKGSR